MFHIDNEFDELKRVLMCKPTKGKGTAESNQFTQILNLLLRYDCTVTFLPNNPSLPEQIFTRDVAFVIGNTLYSGILNRHRAAEREHYHHYLNEQHLQFVALKNHIEGGDVLVHGEVVFVGESGRTSQAGIAELRELVGSTRRILSIPFPPRFLHLDCIFNILDRDHCLIFPPAFDSQTYTILTETFAHILIVSDHEQPTLATNLLTIATKTVIAASNNPETASILRLWGWTVLTLNLTEFIDERGGIRCLTQPWVRKTK